MTKALVTAIVATVLSLAPSAMAIEYRTASGGEWGDYHTWEMKVTLGNTYTWQSLSSLSPLPGCGDTATIRNGHTVQIDSEEQSITTLTVQSGGALYLSGTDEYRGQLELCGTSPSLTVDGADGVELDSYGVLWATTDATLSGSGSMLGHIDLDTGQLSIIVIGPTSGTGNVTLQSDITIHGSFGIAANSYYGTGHFYNNGLVKADDWTGAINLYYHPLYSPLIVTDSASPNCSTPRWSAVLDSWLQFVGDATGLHGNFEVGSGDYSTIAAWPGHVETDGLLKLEWHGTVYAAGGGSFNVTGASGTGTGSHFCSGSACSGFSFPITSDHSIYCND